MKYKVIEDLKSDVLYEAYGKDKEELFENAAEGLFSIICQIEKVEPKKKKEIEVEGEDPEDLMFNWLQELITAVDVDEMFFSEFRIKELEDTHLKAICLGESTSPEKGETVVKALTYYKYGLKKTKKGYKVTVSLDI